jgi:uncharacterized protein YgiM (DUF1202 family)
VLALLSSASARTAVLKERARLREGPGAQTALLGELATGTRVEIKGDSGGWRQVETEDGKTGYLWAEHLTEKPDGEAAAAAPQTDTPRPADKPADATPSRGLADEVRALRTEVTALRERPEPASAADLERVRAELERLSSADRDLARRIDDRGLATPAPRDIGTEPLPGGSVLLLGLGVLVGWAMSRLAQRRRDRRQRNRLRL